MRKLIKTVLLGVALAAPFHVQANNIPVETCRAFADVVYAIAQRRDQGESIYDVRSIVIQKFDESIREPSLALVDMVFQRPWGRPSQEADNFLKQCLNKFNGNPAVYTY